MLFIIEISKIQAFFRYSVRSRINEYHSNSFLTVLHRQKNGPG